MHRMARIMLGMVALGLIAEAAELNVSVARRDDGVTYDALFNIDAPQKVLSGLQINIGCDPDQASIQAIEASEAVLRQDKELAISQPERGIVRVLLVGANAFPLLNGDVLKVTFTIQDPAVAAGGVLQLRSVTAVSPEGDVVTLRTTDAEGGDQGTSQNARQNKPKPYRLAAGRFQLRPR